MNRPSPGKKAGGPNTRKEIITRIIELAEPLCAAEGLELVHVEFQFEPGGKILRIYLDKAGGLTLDDCVTISRQLSDILDVHLEIGEPYRLEVSSPGADRPLSRLSDFQRFKGETASIRTTLAIEGQKNFKGVLIGISDETVMLLANDKTINIPYDNIAKARLVNYNGENRCL